MACGARDSANRTGFGCGGGVRCGGDAEKAAKVYEGVAEPLTADDVADTIAWAVTRPPHVNIDLLVVRPRAQASNSKVHREAR